MPQPTWPPGTPPAVQVPLPTAVVQSWPSAMGVTPAVVASASKTESRVDWLS